MNSAFVATALYLALRMWASTQDGSKDRTGRPQRWLILLALVCGLSLTHHRTTVLLLPGLAVFAWYVTRRNQIVWSRIIPLLVAVLLLPQFLYLYIPLRAPYAPYASLRLDSSHELVLYEQSLGGFVDLVMAGAFGGQLAEGAVTGDRVTMAVDLLARQFTWIGVGLGVLGILAGFRRRDWPFLILTIVPWLTYVAFNLVYFIGDIYVLFIPPYQFWVLWIGLGVWEIVRVVSAVPVRHTKRLGWVTAIPILVSFALPFYVFASALPAVNQRGNREAERMWQPILTQELPEDAILVSNDRDEIMPMWYFQYIDGRRPGWLGMFPLIVREPGYADVTEVIDRALDSGRPVYLIKPMPGLELKYALEPAGAVVRVVAPLGAQTPEHALDISFDDTIRLLGYDVIRRGRDSLEDCAVLECTSPDGPGLFLVRPRGRRFRTDGSERRPPTGWRVLPDDCLEA